MVQEVAEVKLTEIKITLNENRSNPTLLGFASITLDDQFAIRDIKILYSSQKGCRFLAMPSRRIMDNCPKCEKRNWVQAKYCNFCGIDMGEPEVGKRSDAYEDVAFPISRTVRDFIEAQVMQEYGRIIEEQKDTQELTYSSIDARHA